MFFLIKYTIYNLKYDFISNLKLRNTNFTNPHGLMNK